MRVYSLRSIVSLPVAILLLPSIADCVRARDSSESPVEERLLDLTRRGYVTVTVRTTVLLPLAPPFLDLGLPAGLPVEATATEQVSRFWGSR